VPPPARRETTILTPPVYAMSSPIPKAPAPTPRQSEEPKSPLRRHKCSQRLNESLPAPTPRQSEEPKCDRPAGRGPSAPDRPEIRVGPDEHRVNDEAAAALATPNRQGTSATAKKERPPSAADVLARIGLSYDLWHDPTQTGYATVGRHTRGVRSEGFRQYLVNEYRKRSGGKVPNTEAVKNALAVVEAAAVYDGAERVAHTRIAGHDGRVYLHLADREGTVIEIDGDGWRVCDRPPVRFRKPAGMLALPTPVPGGKLAELRGFLNVPDDPTFALVVGWLMGCFRPDGPFPALVLLGEQGSAKTTTARALKQLIDPSSTKVQCEPKDPRDLMIQGRSKWVLAFDNLSSLPVWLSDALCRLATGGGFSTRALYTDDEEVIFDAKRPLIVNGIEDFVTRADLLERSILIRHPAIPDGKRRLESEFWAAFDAAHPRLLGAVLDRVSAGLRELPGVRLDRLPRMADFALFAVACERGAGEPAAFLAAYAENQAGAHEQALDASPLPAALLAVLEGQDSWEGTPAELLAELDRHAPTPPPKDWPKRANTLTNKLRRLAPNLRRVHGLDVDCDGRESGGRSGGKRSRVVRITRTSETGAGTPSPPSPPSPGPANPWGISGDHRPAAGDGPRGRWNGRAGGTVPGDRPPARPTDRGRPDEFRDPGDDGDGGDDPSPPLAGPPNATPGRNGTPLELFPDQMLPD
jgi:hypothetical protein